MYKYYSNISRFYDSLAILEDIQQKSCSTRLFNMMRTGGKYTRLPWG